MTNPPATEPPLASGIVGEVSDVATGWCRVCKAWTRLTATLLLLAPEGVFTAGTRTWCEICDDPECPLPPRRIDRG